MQVPLPKFVTDAAWQGHSFQWFVKPVPKSPNDLVAPQSANLKKNVVSKHQWLSKWRSHLRTGEAPLWSSLARSLLPMCFCKPVAKCQVLKKNLVMPPNASFDDMPPNKMVPKHVGLKNCVQNQWLLRLRSLYLLKREPGVSLSNLRGWSFHQIV